MNEIFIQIDGDVQCSLSEFIEANTDCGQLMIDIEDIETIRRLPIGGQHFIPGPQAWIKIERIKGIKNQ